VRDRYTIVVGLLFVAVIAIAVFGGIGDDNGGILGLDKKPDRWPLPEFAVPAAEGTLEGDANIAQDNCETSQLPCPESAQRTPACRIDTAGAIRICDLFDRPLILSFWFSKGGNCVSQQDSVEQAYARYGGQVNFLSVDVRDDRDTVSDLVREHGWTMPVGYDRDGAVASLYRVGGCPTFAYVYPGGTLQSASSGILTAGQLGTKIEALRRATRMAEAG
jgi:thiol-disulfide isomerase/thioredoxin